MINGLDDEGISEILRRILTLEDIEDTTKERVLLWTQRVEAQRVQEVVLSNIKEVTEFDCVRHSTPKQENEAHKKEKE